ncbi:LOW QUALITY PROTEIN: hypothetical protein JCM24511_06292 [Saitozyma sp. JCM 24511]|nr:LOW QUALITY PROTEIN: hypothetical protein JCM24511_06292 [Saitozyma sp. JCM 24511]
MSRPHGADNPWRLSPSPPPVTAGGSASSSKPSAPIKRETWRPQPSSSWTPGGRGESSNTRGANAIPVGERRAGGHGQDHGARRSSFGGDRDRDRDGPGKRSGHEPDVSPRQASREVQGRRDDRQRRDSSRAYHAREDRDRGWQKRTSWKDRRADETGGGISIGRPVNLVKEELEVVGKGMPMPSDECQAGPGGRGNTAMHLVSVVGETTRNHEVAQVDLRSGIVVILAEDGIAHRQLEAREGRVQSTVSGDGRAPILDVEGGTARRPKTTDPVRPNHRIAEIAHRGHPDHLPLPDAVVPRLRIVIAITTGNDRHPPPVSPLRNGSALAKQFNQPFTASSTSSAVLHARRCWSVSSEAHPFPAGWISAAEWRAQRAKRSIERQSSGSAI